MLQGSMGKKVEDQEKEIWKPIGGYEKFYEVSSYGKIRRIKRGKRTYVGRFLNPSKHLSGYNTVCLYRPGIKKFFKVHTLVCAAFLGNKPSGYQVNHKDCNKTNNYIKNLEYMTLQENVRHAVMSGRLKNRGDPWNRGISKYMTIECPLCKNKFKPYIAMQKPLTMSKGEKQ